MFLRNHIFAICSAVFLTFFPHASFAKPWELNSNLSCLERDTVIDRMANGTKVKINTSTIEVGEQFTINWSRGRFPEREPIYLMISFDQPVRFKGKALYGLLPNATAGFEISWEKENTRAVIPFYGRGIPKTGKLTVEPLQSGRIDIKWAVVAYNGCSERIDTPNDGAQSVLINTSGKPEIVVNDPDDFGEPKVIYINKSRTRHLQVFDGRFRLLDRVTGAEILNEVGTDLHFSPTGRYLVVQEGSAAGVYDTVDGEKTTPKADGLLQTSFWESLVWGNEDSFFLRVGYLIAYTDLWNPVTALSTITTDAGARIAPGTANDVRLDLENNVILSSSYNERKIHAVTAREIYRSIGDTSTNANPIESALSAAAVANSVTALEWPTGLEYTEQLKLGAPMSDIYGSARDGAKQDRMIVRLNQLYVEPTTVGGPSSLASSDKISESENSAMIWRSVDPKNPPQLSDFVNAGADLLGNFSPSLNNIEYFDFRSSKQTILSLGDLSESQRKKHDQLRAKIASETGFSEDRFDLDPFCSNAPGKIAGNFTRAWRWEHESDIFWLTTKECYQGNLALNDPETRLYSSKVDGGIVKWPSRSEYSRGTDTFVSDSGPDNVCTSHIDACNLQMSVAGNLLILYSDKARGYALLNLDTGQPITVRFDLPRGDLFDSVLISDDARNTISLQTDGKFVVDRLADGQTVLQGLYADNEVIVWTEDGRYDATAEGGHFVSYKFPGHFSEYTAQQFEGFLKVPGLAKKVMNGGYTPFPVVITPPPVLRARVNLNDESVDLEADAKGSVPVKSLSVFQDGLLTDTLDATEIGLRTSWKRKINLLPGTKWISLVAIDDNGVASAPYGLEIVKPNKKRNVHIFSTGVNTYEHSKDDAIYNLGAAVADAKLFTNSLSKLTSDKIVIASQTELLEHEASPNRILKELEGVVSIAKIGNTIAFYFAGHGIQGKDDKLYLATSNTDVSDIEGTALAFDKVASVLRKSKARIVMFLDACHSGVAGQGLFSTNDDVVDNVLQQVPSGIVVFSAAKGREFALEDEFADNGFFARAVADVIDVDRSKHDVNNNGSIELSELFRGVKSLVVNRVKAAQEDTPEDKLLTQTPWMARNRMVGDFALF